ncbi:MAG TPA: PIG-L family deacetylase [Patescibacteria group bacterium]|nr:PIG-L family deacetylase [Patescibacteria group bacterium]
MRKLLGIFAHPDDESVACGGTIAKYAKNDWQIDFVTATRGDKGGDPDIRTKELEEAAGILGVRSITFLDFKDGKLSGMTPGEIEDALVKVLTQVRPDVVITHEPQGITNHPDHIRMSYAATFAFQEYAKDYDEAKLYYACFPETIMSYLVKTKRFPFEHHGRPVHGMEDKRITTVIDIKRFAGTKRKALKSHSTQRSILEKYLNNDQFFRQEYFVLRMVGLQEVFLGKNDRISDRL